MSSKEYLVLVDWKTVVEDVVKISPTTYRATVKALDINEPGAGTKQAGYYLKDFLGNDYSILSVDGNFITVNDDFELGYGPTQGRIGRIYESVQTGESPFVSPTKYGTLDKSAEDNSKSRELDIIWKHRGIQLGSETNVTNVEPGNNMAVEPSLLPPWKGGKSKKFGVKLVGITGRVLTKGANGEIVVSDIDLSSLLSLVGLNANHLPFFNGTKLADSGAHWEEIAERILEVSSFEDFQLRVGVGELGSAYTYDIGRALLSGYLTFFGNQPGSVGYIFSGVNGKILQLENNLADFQVALKAAVATYSTGLYDIIVKNKATGIFEKITLAVLAAALPTLNQNTTGTAAGLAAAYIDWNAISGGSSILNKPSLVSNIPYDIDFEFTDVVAGTAKTYTLDIKAKIAHTIEGVILETDAGTLTGVAVKINTTAVTALDNLSVSAALSETASTGAKTVALDDRVYISISTGYTGAPTLIRGKLLRKIS